MEETTEAMCAVFILLHATFVLLVQFSCPVCPLLHIYADHIGNDTCLFYPYIEMAFCSNHLHFAFMFLTEEYT